jgi:hypothetical protein
VRGVLGFVALYLDGNVEEDGQLEHFLEFDGSRKCDKEQGKGNWCSFWGTDVTLTSVSH